MWSKNKSILIIWALLLIQLVAAGTTRQGRRAEDAAYPNANGDVDADGFHTFTRQGVTLRIQPRTRTIRIDGRNASPAQLLEQAKQARQLELLAVRQLLNTRHPVKRTSFENGRKQTSTYTLEPDGSIVCKIVDDIDMADVDRRFEEIFQKQREKQAKEQPNKIADWEWSEDNDEPAQRPIFRAPLQPYPAGQPYVPTSPQSPQPAEQQPTFYQPPRFQPAWPTRDQDDPFNPPGLPAMNSFDDDEEDLFDAYDKAYPSPVGPTNTVSSTNTDKDGNVVHTTLTTGPNEWKRKTVKTSTNTQARPVEEPSTTVRNIPNLDDFLREQYNPSPKAKPESVTPSTTTSTTPKIIKTINVQDLPPIALLNPNKQLDEEFLQPLTPNADGEQPRPIKTLRVDNIPPSSIPDMDTDRFEQRKVQTLTKTIHGNQMPTAADLDPKMLDMLQRAGITPEDIANANGQTITKTRVEPDGRTVTTKYSINRGNTLAPSSFDAPNRGATYPEDTNNWRPYGVPSVFRVSLPPKHQSASHFGVDFTPFSAGSVAAAVTTTTTARPLVRDREPLEPQDEDNENSVTLNPLLIHPVQPVVTKTLAPSDPKLIRVRSPIAEFLVKCGLSVPDLRANKGEYVRTFLDPDGSVLTARFILTGPIMYPVLNY
ncbi:proteoglycan 4 [Bactrocera dorsalis]|uniref:Proteoglycan 4 n=1 Tax=Bactrocera dorsalis TaxID=27457 RepID=A0A6I9VK77_BACDO|nr:proteoglycan 4 [Bactrocera dorsalis]